MQYFEYTFVSSSHSTCVQLCVGADLSGVVDVRILGQTEDSIQVDWQNPETEVDYFKLHHTSPDGQEERENVAKSQEARTVHTIIGKFPSVEQYMLRHLQ